MVLKLNTNTKIQPQTLFFIVIEIIITYDYAYHTNNYVAQITKQPITSPMS
jgi:hypothetical protein